MTTPRAKTAKKKAPAKPPAKAAKAESELRHFPDINLRLAIVQALQDAELLRPFDKEAFYEEATGEPYDDNADYNYEYNEDIARAITGAPVTAAMLAKIDALSWDATCDVIFDVWTHFDGESEEFEIRDLTGIGRLTGLRSFSIDHAGHVERLDPFTECPALEELVLVGGAVSDLTPLRSLPKLRKLTPDVQEISDLSPLAGLAIEELSLDGNDAIDDLAPLLAMPKLKSVSLERRVYATGSKPPILAKKRNAKAIDELRGRGVEVKVQ